MIFCNFVKMFIHFIHLKMCYLKQGLTFALYNGILNLTCNKLKHDVKKINLKIAITSRYIFYVLCKTLIPKKLFP